MSNLTASPQIEVLVFTGVALADWEIEAGFPFGDFRCAPEWPEPLGLDVGV